MALRLKNRGIGRVRPLEGGLDGWRELGYDLMHRDPDAQPDHLGEAMEADDPPAQPVCTDACPVPEA